MSRIQLTALERTTIRSIVDSSPVLHNLLLEPESADALCEFLRSLYLPDTPPMPDLSEGEKSIIESITTAVSGTNIGKQFANIDEDAYRRYMEGGND